MSAILRWYCPRTTDEQWQLALFAGQCIGWDMCRLLGDLNPGLALWDFVGSILAISGYIAVVRKAAK